MSSPALAWFGRDGRRSSGSRGTAAILAIALNLAFLYLFAVAFRLIPVSNAPAVESTLTRFIDQQRGQYREADLRTISVHLNKLALRIPDTPPNIHIDVPLVTPKVQLPSDIRASLPPGIKEKPGADSSRGSTEEPGEGTGAATLHEVGPVYPAASVRSREQGVVGLRVLVDEQGRPKQVRLLQSSGFPRLDESAANAVRRYRFSPPTGGFHAGQSWTTVAIEFDLPPLPVPTTIVGFDSVIAKQIATAARVDRGGVFGATNLLRQLADDIVDFNSRRSAGKSVARESRSSLTPLQALRRQGKAKSVDFVGYASRDFDCGTANLPADSGNFRCGIFKVRQVRGTSYWLAAMTRDGTVKSVAVTVAPGLR